MVSPHYVQEDTHLRLELEPEVWFYLNHMRAQKDHVAHTHNFLEVAFVLNGRGRHFTVKGETQCRIGSVIVIPRGAWHAYAECHDLELVNCLLSPQMLGRELAWLKDDTVLGSLFGLRYPRAIQEVTQVDIGKQRFKALHAPLRSLERAYERGASRLLIVGLLLQALALLKDSMDCAVLNGPGPQEHPAVRQAMILLDKSIDEAWSLARLAACLQLNPSYLVRLFRSCIGMPPMKYLAAIRAERAANLLLSSSLRIGEIGLRVGWGDPKLFSRSFRQHFGMTAGQYRKQMLASFRSGT